VEAAKYKGKPLTYKVPVPNDGEMQNLSSSFMISSEEAGRSAPEYVHARHKVLANGKIENLNNLVDVEAAVRKGGYDAVHPQLYQWTRVLFGEQKIDKDFLPPEYQQLKIHKKTRGADVTRRIVSQPAGEGYFLVGDAAMVLDPALTDA
jgi:hypothetical protein